MDAPDLTNYIDFTKAYQLDSINETTYPALEDPIRLNEAATTVAERGLNRPGFARGSSC